MNNNYNETEFQKELIAGTQGEFVTKVTNRFTKFLHKPIGFETGPGWRPMLWALLEEIEVIAIPYKIEIELQQVKEKFGSLRFYYMTHYKEPNVQIENRQSAAKLIESIVDSYEEKSCNICDMTGRYYKYRIASGSWVYACCYDAFIKRFETEPQIIERARKDIVSRIQFDRIIDTIKQDSKERQFISSLYQTGLLSDYLDDVSISKLVETEFWLDSNKL